MDSSWELRVCFAAAACCALGCTCVTPLHCLPLGRGPPTLTGAAAGERLLVDVPITFGAECNGPTVTSATATVLDPTDHEVPNVAAGGVAAATVDFTPPVPGPYHITVHFEPSLGSRQIDFLVATDLSDAGSHSVPAPPDCQRGAVAGAQPLCLGGGLLIALGPDGGTDEIDAGRISVDDSSRVWALDATGANPALRVYVLDGGAFVPIAATPTTLAGGKGLIARGGYAATVDSSQVVLWALDGDGGINATRSYSLTEAVGSAAPPAWCMQFTPPDELVFVGNGFSPRCWAGAGGLGCSMLSGESAGADDDGVWWSDGTSLQVQSAAGTLDGGGIISANTFQGFFSVICDDSDDLGAIENGTAVFPRVTAEGIVLEQYAKQPGSYRANAHTVWTLADGRFIWWNR